MDITTAIVVAAFVLAAAQAVRTLVRQRGRTGWPAAEAQVVQVRAELDDASGTAGTVLLARCRFRTRDGREVDAWADGRWGHPTRRWVGRWRTAWYDPEHPETFVLVRPRRLGADLLLLGGVLAAFGTLLAVLVVTR